MLLHHHLQMQGIHCEWPLEQSELLQQYIATSLIGLCKVTCSQVGRSNMLSQAHIQLGKSDIQDLK